MVHDVLDLGGPMYPCPPWLTARVSIPVVRLGTNSRRNADRGWEVPEMGWHS